MSKRAAQDLHLSGLETYSTFTDVLRHLQMETCLDTRQISILIELNYFEQFGKSGKLMKVYNEFFEGKNKLTKTIKSYDQRLEMCRQFEKSLNDEDLDIKIRLASELSNIGLCLSVDNKQSGNLYFVRKMDDKYGIKATLYSVKRGTTGVIRFRKNEFAKLPFKECDCIILDKYTVSPRFTYKGGQKAEVPGEQDIWAESYSVLPQ